jgi:hypothetical protein
MSCSITFVVLSLNPDNKIFINLKLLIIRIYVTPKGFDILTINFDFLTFKALNLLLFRMGCLFFVSFFCLKIKHVEFCRYTG